MKYITLTLLLISVLFVSYLLAHYSSKRFGFNRTKTMATYIAISTIYTLSLFYFFGVTAITLKGLILLFILMYSSSEDIKARECDDYLHLMIVIAGFIGTELSALPCMLISAIFVFAIMIGTILVTNGDIGGADIKMSVACAFLLGIRKGILGLICGLILAVIFNIFKKNKKAGFPLIPYLAVGFMTAYFI